MGSSKNNNSKVNLNPDIKFLEQLLRIIQFAKKDRSPFFVSISGAAATGKSTIARNLVNYLEYHRKDLIANILPLDSFMFERTYRAKNKLSGYDSFAHHIDKAVESIVKLKKGITITYRPYNHKTGHYFKKVVKLKPSDIIFVEGIHSFHKKIISNINCLIFIDGEREVIKELRFNTDIKERKYSPIDAFQHSESEYCNFKKFILPYKRYADIIIRVQSNWKYTILK